MFNNAILRTAALELNSLDSKEIVKVAGVLRKFKNWWRAFNDPAYKEEIEKLKEDSFQVRHLLGELNKEIAKLQSSIDDTDIGSYEVSLKTVQELSAQLSKELESYKKEADKAAKAAPPTERQDSQPTMLGEGMSGNLYYTEEDRKNPEKRKEMLSQLPEGFDLSIGKNSKPLNQYNWYSDLSLDNIVISINLWNAFYNHLKNDVLIKEFKLAPNQADYCLTYFMKREFIAEVEKNIKEAILNGFVVRADIPKLRESSNVKHRTINQMDVVVASGLFNLPGSNIMLRAVFVMTDMKASQVGSADHNLRMKAVTHLGRKAGALPEALFDSLPASSAGEEPANPGKLDLLTPSKLKSIVGGGLKDVKEEGNGALSIPLNKFEAWVEKGKFLTLVGDNLYKRNPERVAPQLFGHETFFDSAGFFLCVPKGNRMVMSPASEPSAEAEEVPMETEASSRFDLLKLALSSGQEVAKKKTIVKGADLANVLAAGFKAVFGRDPSLEQLGTAWAQTMMEQGGSFNNYNFGNIKATKGWIQGGNSYFTVGEKEFSEFDSSGKKLDLPSAAFRAYASPVEGAADYWRLLSNKGYSAALTWFGTGNALNAGLALGDAGYYTANRKLYSGNMAKLYEQFVTSIAPSLGFKSAPTAEPEEKPEYKAWKGEKPQEGEAMNKEFEDAMKVITAGPVEKLVRTAIEKNSLPAISLLISLNSKEDVGMQSRFAKILASALRTELSAESSIHFDGKNQFEIESEIVGSQKAVMNAVAALAEGVSNAFAMSTKGKRIDAAIYPELQSSHKLLDSVTAENHYRKYAFVMMEKHAQG